MPKGVPKVMSNWLVLLPFCYEHHFTYIYFFYTNTHINILIQYFFNPHMCTCIITLLFIYNIYNIRLCHRAYSHPRALLIIGIVSQVPHMKWTLHISNAHVHVFIYKYNYIWFLFACVCTRNYHIISISNQKLH